MLAGKTALRCSKHVVPHLTGKTRCDAAVVFFINRVGGQGGTKLDDYFSPVLVGSDDSVVMAGHTMGTWGGSIRGEEDFAVVKLDAGGNEIWRWQV